MDSLPLWLGTVVCTLLAAAGLLPLPRRVRLVALTAALLLAPVLVVADNWDGSRLVDIRDSPFAAFAGLSAATFAVAIGGLVLRRAPRLLAPLIVLAMPFRIPIDLGGGSANLLLPLYGVIAAGLLAACLSPADSTTEERPPPDRGWLRLTGVALAVIVALYGLQAGYADDISPAVRNVAFFLVPFAVLFHLVSGIHWDARTLRGVVLALALEGLVFALVGAYQYATGDLFWNDKVIAGNEAHAYFRINSLFFDPNILGRYLAVTMTVLAALVAFGEGRRRLLAESALFVVLLATLVVTYSQSSMIALIGGVLVLVALRFGITTGIAAGAAATVAIVAAVALIAGGGVSEDTSGRSGLIEGGLHIAGDSPLFGSGSGSFPAEFKDRYGGGAGVAVESHTEPVTVLAEGGAIGLLAYAGLLFVTIAGMVAAAGPALRSRARGPTLAAALIAVYAVMLVHSLGYAAFLTDPITWALLALASATLMPALAVRKPEPEADEADEADPVLKPA
jgi:putative inorganic carbon (HCO3(-)) transporter